MENVNGVQTPAFCGRLFVGMWFKEDPLKLAQVKHRICHTRGNDIKLVWEGEEGGAPAFSEARDPGPTFQVRAPRSALGWGRGRLL